MDKPMEPKQWLENLLLEDQELKMTRKQKSIIEAAIEVFSVKGYAGSSTSEIAQKAGVAEGTIFRHYKTKKDLLVSIVAPMMVRLIAPLFLKEFAKIIQRPYDSMEEFLRALIRNRLAFVKENQAIVKIMMQELPFHADLRQTFQRIVREHVLQHLTKVIEHYQSDGIIKDVPIRSVIRFIMSNGLALIMTLQFIVPELDWNEEEEIEYTIDMILHGISGPAHQRFD